MLLKACLIGLQLWTGRVDSHRATCCLDFHYSQMPPPPPIPAFLVFGGECRIRPRRRWKGYFLRGWDDNGKIALALCTAPDTSSCCTLTTQDGPPAGADGRTPIPPMLTGSYTCPTRSGTRAGSYTLMPKQAD